MTMTMTSTIRKYLFAFSCLLSAHLAQGQLSPMSPDSTNQFSITGDAGLYATTLPLNLSNKFIYGGFIGTTIKDNAQRKLKSNNKLAIETTGKFSYLSKSKTIFGVKDAFWGIEIGTQVLSYNNYSDDLFKLVFYGNDPYAGGNLELAKTRSNSVWYHNIGITGGLTLKNKGKFDNVHLSITPSFLAGVLRQDFELNKGNFLTETNGEYIQFDFEGNYTASDSLYDAFSPKGYGAKIDLGVLLESKNNKIGISITDLGLISWTNKLNYSLDTNFTFGGVEIEDIFSIEDTLISVAEFKDSTFTNNASKSTNALPMLASVYFEHSFSDELVLKNWLKYRLVSGYIPFLMSQINYQKSGFTGGVSAAYGGYTGLQAGVILGYDLGPVNVNVGTTNLLGFINQKNQYSQNIYGRLTAKF